MNPTPSVSAPAQLILTRSETAAALGRKPGYVSALARRGLLHPVVMPGRRRGCGFSSTEVLALVARVTSSSSASVAA